MLLWCRASLTCLGLSWVCWLPWGVIGPPHCLTVWKVAFVQHQQVPELGRTFTFPIPRLLYDENLLEQYMTIIIFTLWLVHLSY